MSHADSMRFHGMTLSIIIISNITVVVVAHFLLAASLTVRHGSPAAGFGSSSGCGRLGRRREKRTGAPTTVAAPREKAGCREGVGGAPAALGAAGPRARRGEVAAPTRGTAEGEGSQAKTPPLAAGPGRAH